MKVSKATHNHVLSFLEPPLRLADWKPSRYGKQINIQNKELENKGKVPFKPL